MAVDLSFLEQSAPKAAQQLLGWRFYKQEASGLVGGTIIETEAYNQEDAASHSYNGPTSRNQVMFGPAGHLYVYFSYGLHYCANIVTGPTGQGAAVLLRTIIPDSGLEIMRARRQKPDALLTNGPAKICQALAIDLNDIGQRLNHGQFLLLPPINELAILAPTTRVGISKDHQRLWRFTAELTD